MKNLVVLKSFSSGISVIMDATVPFDELLEAGAEKFRSAANFFKDAAVAISLEGRTLDESEERQVLDAITENSQLKVLCLMGRDEEKNIKFLGIQNNLTFQKDENCGQFYRGTLRDGQSIETEHSIVILGDVSKGCSVYSAKDIVVTGSLEGEAYAGATGNNHHFVVALDMNPEKLRIGDLHYIQPGKSSKWGLKPKSVPKIAYTYNGVVQVEPITKELLDNFTL
mgnify:FL=1